MTLRLAEQVHAQLRARAVERDTTVTALIRTAVDRILAPVSAAPAQQIAPDAALLTMLVEDAVTYAVDADEAAAGDGLSDVDFDHGAYLIARCRLIRAHLLSVEDALTKRLDAVLHETHRYSPVVVPGVGSVEVRRGADRKAWDHDGLLSAVIAAQAAKAGGEIPDPFTVAREWLLGVAHVDYWRSRALKALGIDVDDYCEWTPGRLAVQITTTANPTKENRS